MPKFKIVYGLSRVQKEDDIIEADDINEAQEIAYEAAMEIVNSWIVYSAKPVEDEKS